MKKSLLICFAFTLFNVTVFCQQVLMQGWYWDYPKTINGYSWADTLRLKAAQLKQDGITHIWFPPHAVASFGAGSNGYDPKDLFIGNQTTGLGTRPALNAMLNEFTAQGIAPVADVIFNHRDGGVSENNPAVKSYITQYYTDVKEPFLRTGTAVFYPLAVVPEMEPVLITLNFLQKQTAQGLMAININYTCKPIKRVLQGYLPKQKLNPMVAAIAARRIIVLTWEEIWL